MQIDTPQITSFQKLIWQFYAQQGRTFEWRNVDDPYLVFISEVMLQQTQTARVAQKFPQFIAQFPSFAALASATLKEVLKAWQGMGYNRRGKYLHDSAKKVMQEFGGILPNDPPVLETFPGIGKATAASICAFAFNKPTIFIETNIRSVFIFYFFSGKSEIHDKEIYPLVAASVDQENPREWYYALMDYGVMLKKQMKNPSRKSAHHAVQSKFEGSDRQIRGAILRILTKSEEPVAQKNLCRQLDVAKNKMDSIICDLISDGLVSKNLKTNTYKISENK
jgi:A/G-specific adenine glycosylase